MIRFSEMTARQARAYLGSWVATTPDRRRWLEQQLAEQGRPPLRMDVDSLIQVAQWLGATVRLREGVVLGGRIPDLSGSIPTRCRPGSTAAPQARGCSTTLRRGPSTPRR